MDDHVSITLLRHGSTLENEQKKYLGWQDASLSEKGIAQLHVLKKQRYPQPDVLLASDLKRCKETATILYENSKIQLTSLFREYDFGDWDTKTYEDLKDDKQYQKWIYHPMKITPPNGESFQQFRERVMKGWELLLDYFSDERVKNIVLVTHGGVIRLLLHHFTNVEKHFWEWSTPNGQGYSLIGKRSDMRRGERCILLQEVPSTVN